MNENPRKYAHRLLASFGVDVRGLPNKFGRGWLGF